MKQDIRDNAVNRYIIPIAHSVLWVIALYIGTIGILSINNVVPDENVRKAQILIGAFAIYIYHSYLKVV